MNDWFSIARFDCRKVWGMKERNESKIVHLWCASYFGDERNIIYFGGQKGTRVFTRRHMKATQKPKGHSAFIADSLHCRCICLSVDRFFEEINRAMHQLDQPI